ncbi:hypothetical protein LDENG_00219660 [Lucifuga dentata]|nr:hypothetical protein LDENG_00219660 [Lucifuga dentata]
MKDRQKTSLELSCGPSTSEQQKPDQDQDPPQTPNLQRVVSSRTCFIPETSMHRGYLSFLFLVVWAELTEVMAFPVKIDVQSITENLQVALQHYSISLREMVLPQIMEEPCRETAVHLNQSSLVVLRLSQYQVCLQLVQSSSPDKDTLQELVRLNQDLIQHLGLMQAGVKCPSSLSPDPSDSFDSLTRSIQSVNCWSQQVAALRR